MKGLVLLVMVMLCTHGCIGLTALAPPGSGPESGLWDQLTGPSMKEKYHMKLEEDRMKAAIEEATLICEKFGTTTVCRPNTPR